MSAALSSNTQAILLLTAPLIAGRGETPADLLTLGEYKRLARFLRDQHQQPSDLLRPDAAELLRACQPIIARERLEPLLARGFLLGQAVERWHTRSLWVVSRADGEYPKRLKTRLKDDAPPVLYGCGDVTILETGGLAVVGSRHVDDGLAEYAEGIGRLVATAGRTVASGGARGVDQAAMRGALNSGGKVVGVMADSLERAAVNREHRRALMDGRLVLISPYDPAAGFNVGHAMQRNKLVYALADAALVVSADYATGGTWAGAIEQLESLRLVPVYVRSTGEVGNGLAALRQKGALPWPNATTPEELIEALAVVTSDADQLSLPDVKASAHDYAIRNDSAQMAEQPPAIARATTPAEELFAKVRSLVELMNTPRTDAEVAFELGVSKGQAKAWLQRLVKEGVLQKLSKPTRYRSVATPGRLF